MIILSTVFWMFLSYPITVFITFLGTLTLTAAIYIKSLFRRKSGQPLLYYKDSLLTKSILEKCQTMQTKFKPPFWIRGSHVQTILGVCSFGHELQLSRKYIQMKDKGVVSIGEMVHVIATNESAPIVLVVPDIVGSKSVVTNILEEAKLHRYRPVLFNGRGQNGNKLTTAKLQSYGDPEDMREVIQYLKYRYRSAKISAVGIGSGADLLMSYLGEFGSSTHLQSVVCISSTYDSEMVYREQIPKIYEILYLTYLKYVICRYMKDFSSLIDICKMMKTWSMDQFVETVFCTSHDLSNSEEYWENNSPLRDVDEISTPVLCVNSLDDPWCSLENIPYDLFTNSPNMCLVTTDYGGHGGFIDGPLSKSWLAKMALEYIKTLLEFQAVKNGYFHKC